MGSAQRPHHRHARLRITAMRDGYRRHRVGRANAGYNELLRKELWTYEKGVGMNITTTFRQMDGTEAVRSYAETKVSKLQKFLRQAIRADVTLSVDGNEHIAEVHVKSGATHLHGSERSGDMYASIDLVIDKLESQIRTANGTRVGRKRSTRKPAEILAQVERTRS